ncbi:hypothetical protein BGZ58_000113 [Dissophora ornata]|nr:hypothetical protein BGZ58_000113 [Dissophora ornata]
MTLIPMRSSLKPERISVFPGIVLEVIVPEPLLDTPSRSPPVSAPNSSSSATTLVNNEPVESACFPPSQEIILRQDEPLDEQDVVVAAGLMKFLKKMDIAMDNTQALQKQMDLKLQQVLDRVAIIQKRVESIITQTYELHEYPIPRLFIVLPKVTKRRDRITKPFMRQFRLYFLCECGAHTKTERSRISHDIHLAKHDGYDLDRPDEFFKKYGSYVLTMMQMIKYGIAVAGVVVPTLTHFKVAEGIEAVQKTLDLTRTSFGKLVDETISFIQNQQNPSMVETDNTDDSYGLERLEVLEGADLRQLESYLSIKDRGRVLGNLYRIVTFEGHVKWVCMDHYRENYRESAMQQLREIVDANHGEFSEEYGKIVIKITSKTLAKQFYDAMDKARGIRELDIKLDWDVALEDLRTFESAVSKACIVHLAMDGGAFKGPSRDLFNNGRRFDPIVQLMVKGRVRSLKLVNFDDFYLRVDARPVNGVSQLRVLSIDSKLPFKDGSPLPSLKKILDTNTALIELKLRSENAWAVLDFVTKKYPNHKLDTLILKFGDSAAYICFSQGKIQTVKADLSNFLDLTTQFELVAQGLITGLSARHISTSNGTLQHLRSAVEQNPRLTELVFTTEATNFQHLINTIAETRKNMIAKGRPIALRQLRLQTFDPDNSNTGEDKDVVAMSLDFSDKSIEFDSAIDVEMRSAVPTANSLITPILKKYGWSVRRLVTNKAFSDDHVAVLDNSTKERPCKLKSVMLDVTSLTSDGLKSMDWIIHDSEDLEHLSMEFQELDDREQRIKAIRTLYLYGSRLNGLTLRGDQASLWLDELRNMLPGRNQLPQLESLKVVCQGMQSIKSSDADWLSAMLKAPPQPPNSTPLVDPSFSPPRPWVSLSDIRFEYMEFSVDSWTRIIRALDFSGLKSLSFENTNFALEQLQLLVELIPDDETDVPLKTLYVKNTRLVECKDIQELKLMQAKLEEAAPQAMIKDLWPSES